MKYFEIHATTSKGYKVKYWPAYNAHDAEFSAVRSLNKNGLTVYAVLLTKDITKEMEGISND